MSMGTDKNKTKQSPQKEHGPEDHTPPRLRTEGRSFRREQTSRCRGIQTQDPSIDMLGPLFFRLRFSCEHLNKMMNFVKIRVCSVVNTYIRKPHARKVNHFRWFPYEMPTSQD